MVRAIGPPVVGVRGNVEEPAVRAALPATAEAEVGGVRIGVVHDGGPGAGRLVAPAPAVPGGRRGGLRPLPHPLARGRRRRLPWSSTRAARPTGAGRRATAWPRSRWTAAASRRWRFWAVDEPAGPLDPELVRAPPLRSADGPVRQPGRHGRLGADGRPRDRGDADLARRRALAGRLRGGDPAAAPALGPRAGRPRPLLITHLHGDHYLGLPGLLKTYGLRGRDRPLRIAGPRGLSRLLEVLRPVIGRTPFILEVDEIDERYAGVAVAGDGYRLEHLPTRHTVPSLAFALVEDERPGAFDVAAARGLGVEAGPDFGRLQRGEEVVTAAGRTVRPADVLGPPRAGRTVVVTGDTEPCAPVLEAARGAAVLVHEATFLDEDRDRARETRHSTAREAAALAREADVGLLVLTHLSSRHAPRGGARGGRARVRPRAGAARLRPGGGAVPRARRADRAPGAGRPAAVGPTRRRRRVLPWHRSTFNPVPRGRKGDRMTLRPSPRDTSART